MTFLNPSILFGLLAASIPVLIHLLNLRKLKKIEFSTLAFLKEIQKTKIRKLKLKQWILLALRVLIILLLVSAFARPTVDAVSIGGLSSSAKTTAVFIVDNSYSMSYVGSDGSFFNKAKSIAAAVSNDLIEGDDATLILTSGKNKDAPRIRNSERFKKIISESNISFEKGDLAKALSDAANILSSSNNFNKQIFVFSDLQKSNFNSASESFANISKKFDENAQFYVLPFARKSISNAGITEFKSENQILEPNKTVSFLGGVANFGTNDIRNLIVSLFINGKRVAQKNIDIDKGKTKKFRLETELNATGVLNVELEIEDDDILYDNKRFLSLYVPEKISVLLLTKRPEDAFYVKTALLSAERKNFSVIEKNINEIYSTDLKAFDVVVLIGAEMTSGYSPLEDYLSGGGSLMLFPSSDQETVPFYRLSSALGLPKPISVETLEKAPVEISSIELNNLIFKNIFENKKDVKPESPKVFKFVKNAGGSGSRAVMKLPDNSAFMSIAEAGKGKAIVFYAAPVLSWSDFPVKNLFSPLIIRSINYLTSSPKTESSYPAGAPVVLNLGGKLSSSIKIESSFGFTTVLPSDKLTGKKKINFTDTFIPGNYTVISDGKVIDYFSINIDANESYNDYFSAEEFVSKLKESGIKGAFQIVSPDDDILKIINETRYGSELWRLFLILALIAAIVEMLISKNAKKEMQEFGNNS